MNKDEARKILADMPLSFEPMTVQERRAIEVVRPKVKKSGTKIEGYIVFTDGHIEKMTTFVRNEEDGVIYFSSKKGDYMYKEIVNEEELLNPKNYRYICPIKAPAYAFYQKYGDYYYITEKISKIEIRKIYE